MSRNEGAFGKGAEAAGFAGWLFRGRIRSDWLVPVADPARTDRPGVEQTLAAVRAFVRLRIDAAAIDRGGRIPETVIEGLAELGVFGLTAMTEWGGLGFTHAEFCRVMELLGGHCGSCAVIVNECHSSGPLALTLFGNEPQKSAWLPSLVGGKKFAALALTEENADPNVHTTVTPSADGDHYLLNGSKSFFYSGTSPDLVLVFADDLDSPAGLSAFLVTPDLPGFEYLENHGAMCGLRGIAIGRAKFQNMAVPAASVLGSVGQGFEIALRLSEYRYLGVAAACTGAAQVCLRAAAEWAANRIDSDGPIAGRESIKKKIAYVAAVSYAMEATTYQTAAQVDGGEPFRLEAAMLEVFATEALWQVVYETLQIHERAGLLPDQPYERIMRDARVHLIRDLPNEFIKAGIVLFGSRYSALRLQEIGVGLRKPSTFVSALWSFARPHFASWVESRVMPVATPLLRPIAAAWTRRAVQFGRSLEQALIVHRAAFDDREYVQERLADAAMALYTAVSTLVRLDRTCSLGQDTPAERTAAELYLHMAGRRFDELIHELFRNDDRLTTEAANEALRHRADYRPG